MENNGKWLFSKANTLRLILIAQIFFLAGCSGPSLDQLYSDLSSPTLSISGTGANVVGSTSYIFANASGQIDTSGNTITAAFSDPELPLQLDAYSGIYTDQMYSGSCSLDSLVASVTGSSGSDVSTSLSATACTDQSVITIYLDTTQIYDNSGVDGGALVSAPLTVDLAPEVASAATGNTSAGGTGTTEGSAGVYSLANDNSIVVQFTKSMTSGSLTATLSGCAATLNSSGAGSVVSTSANGTLVAWTLGNLTAVSSGDSCVLNVSGVEDAAGNPDDPSDPQLSMTFTFQ
jgi:hypothetical protein